MNRQWILYRIDIFIKLVKINYQLLFLLIVFYQNRINPLDLNVLKNYLKQRNKHFFFDYFSNKFIVFL